MRSAKNLLFYVITIFGLFALIYFEMKAGASLEKNPGTPQPAHGNAGLTSEIINSLHHPLAIFLLQIIIILLAVRICGALFKRIGQPPVMGEMAAGIILGPSVLGAWAPELSSFVFPKESLSNLQLISQVGLLLFMFVIGMELDLEQIRKKAGSAVIISHASIVFPYGLGVGLSYFIYREMAPQGVHFYAFALFMGIAMSITAFPVLARIIRERGMTGTRLGNLAITCAAADDITAWCILAFVIAVARSSSFMGTLFVMAATLAFTLIMFHLVKPLLKKLADRWFHRPSMQSSAVSMVFILLLASAYVCEVIGIHALFGAFLAGTIMPETWNFRKILTDKIEDVALGLFLPLFFAFTGLRTQIGLLNDSSLWAMCGIIIVVAIAGKFGGSALAARFTGESWKDSFAIGALMNTRGLMELVVLNIGYDMGILSTEIFAMLVIMALVTTFMTAPLLSLFYKPPQPVSTKAIL